jgi:ankyrin repeat protein
MSNQRFNSTSKYISFAELQHYLPIKKCYSDKVAEFFDAIKSRNMSEINRTMREVDAAHVWFNCGQYNALMSAAHTGNLQLVIVLLDKGARVDDQSRLGFTAVMNCVKHNTGPAMLSQLLRQGPDLMLRNNFGETAFTLAANVDDGGIASRALRRHVRSIRRSVLTHTGLFKNLVNIVYSYYIDTF